MVRIVKSKLDYKYFLVICLLLFVIFGELFVLRKSFQNNQAKHIMEACKGSKSINTCYGKEFFKLTLDTSMSLSKRTLVDLQHIDGKATDCHIIAHFISQAAMNKDPKNWKNLVKAQSPTDCLGGFIHGILEVYLRDKDISLGLIKDVCSYKDKLIKANCVHIMGHMLFFNGRDLEKVLKVCDLIDENMEPYECYAGAIMEYNIGLTSMLHGLPIYNRPSGELISLCNSGKDNQRKACWAEMGRNFALQYKSDMAAALESCSKAENVAFKKKCEEFVIVGFVFGNGAPDNAIIKDACSHFKDTEEIGHCYSYSVAQAVYSSPDLFSISVKSCEDLPEEGRDKCILSAKEAYKLINSYPTLETECNYDFWELSGKCLNFSIL